ncbi:MAG: c-type cytochrome biogenesis protein CcmI [Pseudomonadota bacterium]
MLGFLLAVSLITTVAAVLMVRPLLRGMVGASKAGADRTDSSDAALYRDQLAEIERDRERGVISPAEAEATRAEIARRLIAAAKRAEQEAGRRVGPAEATRIVTIAALVAVPLIGTLVYVGVGDPGERNYPLAGRDLLAEARAQRLGQAEAEFAALANRATGPRRPAGDPEVVALVQQLEQVMAERPDDPEGHRLLARVLFNQGRFSEAWPVYDRLIALEGADADPEHYVAKAEAMILAADGYVSDEAEAALAAALQRDPGSTIARYYAGVALAQLGQTEQALSLWRRLEGESRPDSPYLPVLRELIARAEDELRGTAMAGIDRAGRVLGAGSVVGAPPAGLDPDTAASVMQMAPEEQRAFMEARTDALAERLRAEGGSADDWATAVRALARLDRRDEAAALYVLSQEALTGGDAAFVREQALVNGVPVD